ncbi:synaptic plasticity regulator PANTS isoform X3 [Pongo pygmaeus]|uniref:synaptic plasticity regulator PANTS isoform X3 n=1 Tax=Pongo pygmaeus TaxID=9600 RepID=UPI00300CEA7D
MADGSGWQPPRPCESYRAEWKLCRSARHFLHHYYVHGEGPACEQWQRDLASCRDWEERRSAEAQCRIQCYGGPLVGEEMERSQPKGARLMGSAKE